MVAPLPRSVFLIGVLWTSLLSGPVSAQTRPPTGPCSGTGFLSSSFASWSSLAPTGDLSRGFPSSASCARLLDRALDPLVGLFWNAGNPGALPFEVRDQRAEFALGREVISGDYRRPFDPGEETRRHISAFGWKPLGSRGAGFASAELTDGAFVDGVFSDVVSPYSSSPYVVADTSRANLDQMAARLEAAGGWQIGTFGVGLGVAFVGQETQSVASPVPRLNHSSGPAVRGGMVKRLGDGSLLLGVSGTWRSLNQRTRVYTVAAPTRIYQIDGFNDPAPQDVFGLYERRLEAEGWRIGTGISGNPAWGRWSAWANRGGSDERWSNEKIENPRTDLWTASSTTVGLAGSGRLFDRIGWSGKIEWTGVEGEAEPTPPIDSEFDPDRDPIAFRTRERLLDAVLGGATPMGAGRWEVGAEFRLSQEWRKRFDSRVGVGSDLDMRSIGVSVEVLRRLGQELEVSATGNVSSYSPIGEIPNPASMGPEYRRWIGPEMALLATPASTRHLGVSLRWNRGSGQAYWVKLGVSVFGTGNLATVYPLLPDGDRRSWSLGGGVTLRD